MEVGAGQFDLAECPGPLEDAQKLEVDVKLIEGSQFNPVAVIDLEVLYAQAKGIWVDLDFSDTAG